jgi:hypothetical protein
LNEREQRNQANIFSRPRPLSGKDLDLLVELYEENKQVAIAHALDGVSLGARHASSAHPGAYPPPPPAPG